MEWLIPILIQLPWGDIAEMAAAFLFGWALKQPKMVEQGKDRLKKLVTKS